MTERTISAEEREEAVQRDPLRPGYVFDAAWERGRAEQVSHNTDLWIRRQDAAAMLAALDELASLSAWVSGDVARARELAKVIATGETARPATVAAEIVALLTPPEGE